MNLDSFRKFWLAYSGIQEAQLLLREGDTKIIGAK